MPELRTVAVADAPWDDVRAVFGTRGDPASCWCQFFKVDAAAWKAPDHAARFERALCEQVDAARSRSRSAEVGRSTGPGIIAYLDDQPVGWVAVEPRPVFPLLLNGRIISAGGQSDRADAAVWAVTCFVVRVGSRRRGVGTALLAAAIEAARAGGARVVEAYPVDTAGEKVSSADLYHGALSTFEAAGFSVTGRPSASRAVVELQLG